MAWGTQTNTSAGGNVNLGIQAGYSNVSRSGNTVYATLHGRMGMGKNINNSTKWSSNEFGIWLPAGGTKYVAKAAKTQSTANHWYEKTRDCSWNVGAADTSLTASVGFGWEDWDASQKVTASVSIPFSSGMVSYNMNILNPDGSEPYSTGEAGTVEESINGGGYTRVQNEGASSYGYGTTIAYRNFTPGAHRHLASVSGISPNNTTGPWSLTLTSGTTVEFKTAWNTYYRDINAWKPGNAEQGGLIFDYYIYNRAGTLVNSYTNVTNEVADTVTREYGYTGKINNIRTNVTGAHYTTNNITGTGASEFTWTFNTTTAIELYSAWNTYTVTYNGNGATGGSTANSSHTYNTAKALTANGYTRAGYSFAGWNTAANGSGTSYSNQQSVSNLTATHGGTVTLYAQWTPLTYTMVFNGNGATGGSMSNLTIKEGEEKTITANAFSRTGHTFTGWNSKADGTGVPMANQQVIRGVNETNPNPSFTSGRKAILTGSMTYSATGSPVAPSSQFVSYGHPYSRDVYICNLTAGHTYIVGGYGIADSSAQSNSSVGVHYYTTDNVWTTSKYIAPTQHTWQRIDQTFTIPSNSTQQHLWMQINGDASSAASLSGWYWTGVNCRDMSLSTTQTVYAQWSANSYTVAYNANGGTSTPSTQTAKYGSAVTLASAIKRNNTDANVTITVTYNANGGSGAPGNSTGTAVNTTPYTFNKWALNSASGTQYSAGGSFTIPASNSTMYATWTTGTTTRKSNPSITLSSTKPTRSGYNFKGWSTSSTATTASHNAGTAYTFSANTTLYAVWELAQANLYTKKDGAWVKGPAYVKVDGAWKVAKQVYTKVNGAWVLNK